MLLNKASDALTLVASGGQPTFRLQLPVSVALDFSLSRLYSISCVFATTSMFAMEYAQFTGNLGCFLLSERGCIDSRLPTKRGGKEVRLQPDIHTITNAAVRRIKTYFTLFKTSIAVPGNRAPSFQCRASGRRARCGHFGVSTREQPEQGKPQGTPWSGYERLIINSSYTTSAQ
jgi:hypothetical protein